MLNLFGKMAGWVGNLLPSRGSLSNAEVREAKKLAQTRDEIFWNIKQVGFFSGVGLVAGLGFASIMGGWHWAVEGLGMIGITALSCYLMGSLWGLLFGVPRSAEHPSPPTGTNGQASNIRTLPRENTNLEQISDWLVKVMIGASLTQLGQLKALLYALSGKLSASLVVAKAAALAAPQSPASVMFVNSTNGLSLTNVVLMGNGIIAPNAIRNPANLASPYFEGYGQEFCLFLILYFATLGFLTGYLITRLWLPYAMRLIAVGVSYLNTQDEEELKEAHKAGKIEGLLASGKAAEKPPGEEGNPGTATPGSRGQSSSITGRTAIVSPARKDAEKKLDGTKEKEDADDPNKGKFGLSSSGNNCELSARVTPLEGIDDEYFRINLKLTRTGGQPLDGLVEFHLHPTFNPSVITVAPMNNEALLERFGWGAFTVGAIVKDNGGKEIAKLELDLASVPGAPSLFKSR